MDQPQPGTTSPTDDLAALARRVDLLAARLGELERHWKPAEIRTRKLTIVDEDGEPRVILSTRHGAGSVLVRLPGTEGHTNGAELYAWQAPPGEPSDTGICIYQDGDIARRRRNVGRAGEGLVVCGYGGRLGSSRSGGTQ